MRITKPFFSLSLAATLATLVGCQGLQPGGNGGGPNPPANLQSIQHIVIMLQENRSFDSYFGMLPDYWQANGFPAQTFDGLPANASNPSFDGTTTIPSFRLKTMCFSDASPAWNESHVDWNRNDPTSTTPLMDGYAFNAAKYARNNGDHDTEGRRAMGYYTGDDLNYYYFMASNFATSDRWFSPVMSRTPPNRQYLLAATSAGHVYPTAGPLSNKTIFEALENAGVSWLVYETDNNSSYFRGFQPFADQHSSKIVPATQFAADVQNGTLPQVALIESGYRSGQDEHPNNNVQAGATYVSSFINALMNSPAWKDSVFILTYDEGGGTYDHVPPQPAVPPDDIPPSDLQPGDICSSGGPNCGFNYTGFRVPLIVVSPFSKKNYVSHTVADYTAILKFIETRFNLPALTRRDAAQMDMTEFFDFDHTPWATPPIPPAQLSNGVCDFDQLQY
ncbi:MAG: alkaline phosphatase family protein [Acidobacteria bacterium]|nr:alkaline phosphatase family protein [Acidobacteriota bacterium]